MTSQNPVALITGAARRVGAVIARTLHGAGYDVALHCHRSRTELDALIADLESARKNSTLALQADLIDSARLPELVENTVARFGKLDALVNNAATFHPTPFGTITAPQCDEFFATNARAPLLLAQAAATHLQRSQGSIVNIIDIYAQHPLPGYLPYCVSKAALAMATVALAQQLGPDVRVNGVAPGNVLWSEQSIEDEAMATILQRTALKRQGSPRDIAGAVLWLLRDATYVTGQILRVDGGRGLSI
ncbi:MAG TPA: pteridine reductase [Rhodanobacteraceae bacterium]|nr:pteridine reductase [Rhodanobacteraceae bacterium]